MGLNPQLIFIVLLYFNVFHMFFFAHDYHTNTTVLLYYGIHVCTSFGAMAPLLRGTQSSSKPLRTKAQE